MFDLSLGERMRNDADYFAAGFEHRIGDHAHQSNVAAAVDKADLFLRQQSAKRDRRCRVLRLVADAGPAEHTNFLHTRNNTPFAGSPVARFTASQYNAT